MICQNRIYNKALSLLIKKGGSLMKKIPALVICLMLSLGCGACSPEGSGERHEINTENSFEVISGGTKQDASSDEVSVRSEDGSEHIHSESGSDYAAALFEKDVLEINITADESEWQEMLRNAASKPWVKCGVEINGEKLADVGVKPKGNTSLSQVLRDGGTRFSLKLNFGKYTDGQTFHGLDKLALNNIYSDTTYMKEYMSYKLMEYMSVPCSMCTFANISVNGEHFGFYLAVEDVDESFLDRVYGEGNEIEAYKPDAMDTQMAQAMNGQQFTPPEGMLPQSTVTDSRYRREECSRRAVTDSRYRREECSRRAVTDSLFSLISKDPIWQAAETAA